MSKSVSIKKAIPVSETGSKAVFKIRNAILSTVVISLMSSVAWADSSVQKLKQINEQKEEILEEGDLKMENNLCFLDTS